MDVPRSFALAVLAIIAVAPEYAVDALYAWEAGAAPGTPASENAANLAVANVTGANRILVGLGRSLIALYAIYRARTANGGAVRRREGFLADAVGLESRIGVEIVFLGAATVYALFVPFGGGTGAIDALVLVGIYAGYVVVILRGDTEHEPRLGVAGYLQGLARPRRIGAIVAMFVFSGGVILLAVKPFAKGLETLGPQPGPSSFFMIQWVAPLASESPEFIATAYLVRKLRTTSAFNALISSKLNQWTLLIGTLAVVYSIALGQYGVLEFDAKQAAEIWITAAQSYFALAILVNFTISIREALALLVLFVSQVVIEFLAIRDILVLPITSHDLLLVYTAVYMVVGTVLFATRWQALQHLVQRTIRDVRIAIGGDEVTHPGD